ncbi:MAG TPA: hypothetical protein DCL41_01670 [Bdellovibrionales bacterium]|nr:hypothetical protein [Bdellovibrionales bacterium]|tara:strand:- start:1667 stop:2332 length:666 start_codon:yes stop_codon:yes gene_type:complete
MMSKVIVVEGLPGSGKTTTAQNIASFLETKGHSVELFLEYSQNNPVGFLWNEETIPDAIKKTTLEEYPFSSWLKVPSKGSDITVLESRFLQNTSYFWMLNGKEDNTAASIPKKILEEINGHSEFKLVYLNHSDPGIHLKNIIEERKPKHPNWIPFVTNFHDKQPWLQKRGLEGESGFYKALLYWAGLQEKIFEQLDCSKMEIINPNDDWEDCLKNVFAFVE